MINNFIQQTINLIEQSDFRLNFPEVLDTELEENGTKKISIEFIDRFGANIDIQNNFLLISSISFLLIDTYLDTIYEDLEGKSFKQRYEAIEENSDLNIMLKETYRVLKLIRNTTIHSKSAINIVDDSYIIGYRFRDTDFHLTISKKSFENLISLVLFIIKIETNTNEYIVSLLRTYYKDIVLDISINDEFSDSLSQVASNKLLKTMRRYRVINPTYNINNNILKIKPMDIWEQEKDFSGIDYVVKINNEKYLIPNEILINNKIAITDLEDWLYFDLKSIRDNN